ncbi:MAG: hypothetical protein Q4A18_05175 [Rikenellaceae bacterium]|nr:hypothetical protein [Rikenellaceae bacterium]
MKKMLVTWVLLFAALATAEAQGLGQLYDNGQVRGIVVKLAPDGQPAVIASLQSCRERFCDDKDATTMPAAYSINDGRQNMQAIEQYIAQHGGSFPAYDWCKSLGPGWYLPARNESHDAWIVTFGGENALDNYDQDLYLAAAEVVKNAKGDKMVWDKKTPIPWFSSTVEVHTGGKKNKTYHNIRVVGLHESSGSAAGSFATSMASGLIRIRSRKGGKIESWYHPATMKGSDGVGEFRAFYRLREDAYAAGIYEAPIPKMGVFSDTEDAVDTKLVSANEPAPAPQAPAPAAAPMQQPAPAPQPQHVPQAAPAPAPQAAPAQQPVVYANNSGWDIIVAPGQDIQCRVTRVGEKEIEYKKAGFENGPTYTISRKKAEKIIYANGVVEEVKKTMFDFIKKK